MRNFLIGLLATFATVLSLTAQMQLTTFTPQGMTVINDIEIDDADNVWILGNLGVRRYTQTGAYTGISIPAGPTAQIASRDGEFFVQQEVMRVYNPLGTFLRSFNGVPNATAFTLPRALLALTKADTLRLQTEQGTVFGRGIFSSNVLTQSAAQQGEAVAYVLQDTVFVLQATSPTAVAAKIAVSAEGAAFDPEGNLFLTTKSGALLWYKLTGRNTELNTFTSFAFRGSSTLAETPSGPLQQPTRIAISSLGFIYIIESGANRVRVISNPFREDPFPVELTSFTGSRQGSAHVLNWAAATEVAFDRYEVESSQDGESFSIVHTVFGKGDNSSYSLRIPAQVGTTYYRLRMVDLDGSQELSDVVAISTAEGDAFIFGPNPSRGELTLSQPATLYNAIGQPVALLQSGSQQLNLPAGMYVLQSADGANHPLIISGN